jgi:hypothetical protein
MSSRTSRYAAVTSTFALIVALGGTSYAATKIGTQQLKSNAVTSPKIKNDTVTGTDVKESSLGQVPSAATALSATTALSADAAKTAKTANTADQATKAGHADTAGQATKAGHADTAGQADTVNGVTPSEVFLYTNDSVTDQVLFSGGGLTITASCDAPNFNLDVVATTSKDGSYLSAVGVADSNPSATIEADAENSSFLQASPIDLLLGDDGDVLQVTFAYSNADGSVVTGTLSTDVGNPTCSVRGTVFAS